MEGYKWKQSRDPEIFNKNIELRYRIEFGIEKCAMLIIISRKRETMEGIELQNKESIRKKENYKNFRILEVENIKQTEMKEKLELSTTKEKSPVGWGCRIYWLHLKSGGWLQSTSVLDMTLNGLMVWL